MLFRSDAGFLQQVNYEEVELILRFIESDGVRLVQVDGELTFATFGPNSQLARYDLSNSQNDQDLTRA